jgi:hypothetical protein
MTTPTTTGTDTDFLIQTLDGRTYQKGDTNPTPLGDPKAVLQDHGYEGNFLDLTYRDGLTLSIPEAQIAYAAALNA